MNDVTREKILEFCVCVCVSCCVVCVHARAHHEESKDRLEHGEVPGILCRRRNERYIKAAK